jgi:DNA-directed RNA polymerase specialized sigma24 family protein
MSTHDDEPKGAEPASIIDLASWKVSRDRYRRAEAADWATIAKKLTRYAQKRIGDRPFGDEAEDLAQQAIRHFFEHMDRWDHLGVPLERHLASVVNGIAVNRRRKGPNRHRNDVTSGRDPSEGLAPDVADDFATGLRSDREDPHDPGRFTPAGVFLSKQGLAPDPIGLEDAVAARDHAAEIIRRTLASLEGDELALRVMALFAEGMEMPKEQALALGRPMLEVLAARKRVERRAKKVRDELEGSEES